MDIYAGTSYSNLLLLSTDNGVSFTVCGSSAYGDILCFYRLDNGNVLYGTSQGYVINFTTSAVVKINENNYDITAISQDINGNIWVGDSNGDVYLSTDGISYNIVYSFGSQVNAMVGMGLAHQMVIFTSGAIYKSNGTAHVVGNFRCACDAGNGLMYSGTQDGHIWKSEDYGDTWVDIYTVTSVAIVSIVRNKGRYIFTSQYSGSDVYYTDDDFSSVINAQGFSSESNNQIILVGDDILLLGNGNTSAKIYRSIDNGETWNEIANNPQQGEETINCLLGVIYDEGSVTTTEAPTTTISYFESTTNTPTTTPGLVPMRGVTISHKLPTRVTSTDLVPFVTFVVNPGVGECYEFIDMFIKASYKPYTIMVSTNLNFTDYALITADHIVEYNTGWYYVNRLPRTVGNKVLIGKVLYVKVSFEDCTEFYDLKVVKTGYKVHIDG